MPVREKGRRRPGSQPELPFSRPQPPAECRKVRGFSPTASGFTAETDWLLEESGFEPLVPLNYDGDAFSEHLSGLPGLQAPEVGPAQNGMRSD